MSCKNCTEAPVFELSESKRTLCRSCFIRYFEKRVHKIIRTYQLLEKEDHVGVAVSGGKDSLTVLHLLSHIPLIHVTAIAIDEGIAGYREKTLETLKQFCDERNITLHIKSYKETYGKDLDTIVPLLKTKPCSACGVMRRDLLNKTALELGCTKLATGHNSDDEAQSFMMNLFKNTLQTSARLGPVTGILDDDKFITRIKPLYFVSEKEVATYAFLKGFLDTFTECPYASVSYRAHVRDLLNDFEAQFPGTKKNIIKCFLHMKPLLQETYKKQPLYYCQKCQAPTSQDICRTCHTLSVVQ